MPTTLLMVLYGAALVPHSLRSGRALATSRRRGAGGFALDGRQQVVDVIALEHPLAKRVQNPATLGLGGAVALEQRIPLRRELVELLLVLQPLRFDRLARPLQAIQPLFLRRAALAQLADLVEFLVQREHFLEQRRRHLLLCPAALDAVRGGPHAFELQQVTNPRDRRLERPIRVVQVRRPLEAGAPFGRGRIVEVIRMELAAEGAEARFEVSEIELQPARNAEERKVVTVPAERQNPRALRAEVRVGARAAAAVAADLKGGLQSCLSASVVTLRRSCHNRRSSLHSGC